MLGLTVDYGLAILGFSIGLTVLILSLQRSEKGSVRSPFTAGLMLLLCLASAFTAFRTYESHGGYRSVLKSSTGGNVDKLEDLLVESILRMEASSKRMSNVTDSLWVISQSTDSVILSWQDKYSESSDIKDLMERKVKLEKESLLKDAPQVDLLSYDIKFQQIKGGDYKLIFCPKNLGRRTAERLEDGAVIAFLGPDNQFSHRVSEVNHDRDNLHPFSTHRTFRCTHTFEYPKSFIEKQAKACMLYYWCRYYDSVTGESFFVQKHFIWNGYAVDNYNFNNADISHELENAFHQYLDANKLYKNRS